MDPTYVHFSKGGYRCFLAVLALLLVTIAKSSPSLGHLGKILGANPVKPGTTLQDSYFHQEALKGEITKAAQQN
jgi:hypothetical protein